MKLICSLILSLFFLTGLAQSDAISDPNVTERALNGSFTAIEVSDGIILHLVPGKEEKLAVSYADEKYAEKFKTEVVNGVLKIYYNREKGISINNKGTKKLQAYVSYKKLDKLTASSGARVELPETLVAGDLVVKMSSGAGMEGAVSISSFSIDLSSGSMINISGTAKTFEIDASSGSMFKGFDFSTTNCQAKASSGAGIRMSVSGELDAKANSGGSIHYKGSGVIKDIKVNSGGIVKKV